MHMLTPSPKSHSFTTSFTKSHRVVGSIRYIYHGLRTRYDISYINFFKCNPGLSKLITETLGISKSEWLKDLTKLEGLLKYVDDEEFQEKWTAIKQQNKERLAHHVEQTVGTTINTKAMFDVQIKVRVCVCKLCTSLSSISIGCSSGYTSTRYVK